MAAEEDDGGFAEGAAGGPCFSFPAAFVPGVVKVFFEAAQATADVVADGGVDDAAAGAGVDVEEIDEELGDCFVFAGLAGHNDQEFMATMEADRFDDGASGLKLVGV
jgi:hypothetical protein